MLASLTSMLPSGISFSTNRDERERQDKERERERAAQEETPRANDNDGKLKDGTADEHGVKKKRERNPNETFIVVRPPPSVSNHPLNLQLQLVPPQAKERSASGTSSASGVSNVPNRPSADYSTQPPTEVSESLARAPSTRSNRSDPSSFYASSSSASMSSIASSASITSGGGRRMIVPLYNLSAHNVMTNTVLDAGTDAKVAKFQKRGMEILALAVLECVEVWPSYGRGGAGHVAFLNATNGVNYGATGNTLGEHSTINTQTRVSELTASLKRELRNEMKDVEALLVTPTSSALSLSSAGSHPPHAYAQLSPSTPKTPTSSTYLSRGSVTPTPSQSGAKRIFGKIFKKRDVQSPSAAGVPGSQSRSGSIDIRTVASPPGSEVGHGNVLTTGNTSKRRSFNASSPTPPHFTLPPVPTASPVGAGGAQPTLQPTILGIQPTLSAPLSPPVGRPTRYVWIVRKWLKGDNGGLLGGVMRGVGMVGAGIGRTGLGERAGGVTNSNSNSSMGHGTGSGSGMEVGVEVRFEWARGPSKNQEKRSRRKSSGQAALGKRGSVSFSQEDAAAQRSRRGLATEGSVGRQEKSRSRGRHPTAGVAAGVGTGTPRISGESRRSAEHASHDSHTNSMTSASLSEETQAMRGQGAAVEGDDGEESDPEDSETPWTCTLVVSSMACNPAALWEFEHTDIHHPLVKEHSRRSHLGNTPEGSSSAVNRQPPSAEAASVHPNPNPPPPPPKTRADAPGTLLKLKVGALSPAPHHPKVVAQLKVPYPLPDIEVSRARVRRRVLTPAGVARPVYAHGGGDRDERDRPRSRTGVFGVEKNGEGQEDLVLTAEEIKDVLSCTAFWIVVREGFGGVGKVNRKGDGWRIRG